jgi:hypothetical protein
MAGKIVILDIGPLGLLGGARRKYEGRTKNYEAHNTP